MFVVSRRDFVQGIAGAALMGTAAAGSSAHAKDQSRARRKFTKCLSCGSIGVRADQREAIRLAACFGFESVEPSVDFLARLSDGDRQELLAELKAKKLAWGAAGLSVEFRGSQADFEQGMKKLPSTAAASQQAGVTRVATWLGPSHGSLTYVANFRQHARRLREVANVLADHGQRLGLEYVGPKTSWTSARYPFLHTMAEMKDLIAEINRSNVGFLLDSWHWHTAGDTEADLLTLRNRDVVCVHLNDAPASVPVDKQIDSKRELPCATGVIDLKTFLGALVRIGYDGPVVVEPFSQALRSLPAEQAVKTTADALTKAVDLVDK